MQAVKKPSSAPAKREARARVLVVDDEVMILSALRRILEAADYAVTPVEKPIEALDRARRETFQVALVDLRMDGMTGLELLQELKRVQPDLEVVMMTAYGTPEQAFQAVKFGAYSWLKKPFEDIDEVAHVVGQALEHRRLVDRTRYLEQRVAVAERFDDVIGTSVAMRQVFQIVESAAPSDASILITGESGTGKEIIARAIHRRSPRANRPMVSVNCGAIAESLFESELFGHVKGAFTGASQTRKGHFESADNGTIFLDEVGELDPPTQVKLLRVLQEREYMRVGESVPRRADVRTIAATNIDLNQAKTNGRFREDLYYRLNVISIAIPPLRERVEDIPRLVEHFLKKCGAKSNKRIDAVSPEVMDALQSHSWPGNVRELENLIEATVVFARSEVLELRDVPADFKKRLRTVPTEVAASSNGRKDLAERPFADAKQLAIQRFECDYVIEMLKGTDGNISEAARRSGLDRSNFRRVMLKYRNEIESVLRTQG